MDTTNWDAQFNAQASFCLRHPDYVPCEANGDAMRDKVRSYGDTTFNTKNLERAFLELWLENKLIMRPEKVN